MRNINPTVSVVVPTRNEADNLSWFAARLRPLRDNNLVHEVILVDGNSSDDTVDTFRRLVPDAIVATQTHPGKGAGLAVGLAKANCDIVIMIDADGSMDPAEIPAFVGLLTAGADVVKGSRAVAGAGSDDLSPLRWAGNLALRTCANMLYRQRWRELAYGYAGFWRDILPELGVGTLVNGTDANILGFPWTPMLRAAQHNRRPLRYGHGFEIEAVLFCRGAAAGLRVAEAPSFEYDRRHGTSNLDTWRDGVRVLTATLRERRHLTNLRRTSRKR